jgi:hypothetical protein
MSSPHAAKAARVVATQIAGVTVYRNGALVVRRGRGRGLVEVRDLPLLFSSDSLRVRAPRGAVGSVEETVRLQTSSAPAPVSEEERARVQLEIVRVEEELKTCDLLLERFQGLVPELPEPPAEAAARLVDGRVFVELVGFCAARCEELGARRLGLEKERRALEEERRRIEERARAIPAEAPRVLRGARFTLDTDGPPAGGADGGEERSAGDRADAELDFELEYFVPAARWVPAYALHLASAASADSRPRARLVTAALVAQATGEDWSGVQLAVSTADLSRDTTLPVVTSWRIGRAQPAPLKGYRPLPSDLPSLFRGYDHGPRRPPPPPATPAAPTPPAPPRGSRPPAPSPTTLVDMPSLDSEEVRTFEHEKSAAARMSLGAAQAFFEEAGTEPEQAALAYDDERAPARKRRAGPGAVDERAAAFPPSPPPALAAGRVFAGRPGRSEGGIVRASGELPPRWRTAYLRMAGPEEMQRGSLLPLDPIARLEWLLTGHDLDEEDSGLGLQELRRAIVALQQAQARLEQAALPRGTSLLLGTHFQALMTAPASTDVPGDGTYYRVEVRADEGPATIEHRAVPREANDVWRTCRLELQGTPLPSGPLAVYEDGAFVVNARLDGSGAGKPLEVNLGIEPALRVLSRTVHVKQAEKGLVSQTSRVEHHVQIELGSTARAPALVIVSDRLPVPADLVKDVTVTVLEEKPPILRTNKDAAGNEVMGAFEWRVTVMPGATQALELKYAIDLPAKAELEGGNRRD